MAIGRLQYVSSSDDVHSQVARGVSNPTNETKTVRMGFMGQWSSMH